MKAVEILVEIESQALHILENHNADPVYVVIGKEYYRTLVRHFRRGKIKGSDTSKIAAKTCRGMTGFENSGLKFVVVDTPILAVSTNKTEELFRTTDGKYSDPEIFGEQ